MCVGGRHGGVVGDSLDLFAGENSKANFETYFCVCRQQKTELGSSRHIALSLRAQVDSEAGTNKFKFSRIQTGTVICTSEAYLSLCSS